MFVLAYLLYPSRYLQIKFVLLSLTSVLLLCSLLSRSSSQIKPTTHARPIQQTDCQRSREAFDSICLWNSAERTTSNAKRDERGWSVANPAVTWYVTMQSFQGRHTDQVFSSLHVRRSSFQKPSEWSYSTSELVASISKWQWCPNSCATPSFCILLTLTLTTTLDCSY